MNPEELQRLEAVEDFIRKLEASTTIPFTVDGAFRDRLGLGNIPVTAISAKDPDSSNTTVNESGASTYAVLGEPVGYLQITLGNTTYHIPYYSA